ncbi:MULTISPECIES: ATP-binding protein [Pseudoalteromonas]|uniref:histidine kinase n=1 Tax=Pseudoalteromonas obscura TaxID=3048491 RepID=A0ABT7EJU6_9GAMM|nr:MULTISPECIES: ATP-binding protein [Pseudoalteromonas]MBQ4836878.1 HAMP domain-containing protein [Pseudoalteromonas luteoviolacea]MDK2595310.1 ATP-binding protein [Pseudoalteromonas sp. P94(2023)]
MRLTLRRKLLAILLLVNAVLISAVYYANQLAFEKSFREYLQDSSRAKLTAILPTIRENFENYGEGWMTRRNPHWTRLVGEFHGRSQEEIDDMVKRPRRGPPRHHRAAEPERREGREDRPPRHMRGAQARLVFKSATGELLKGKKDSKNKTLWLEVHENEDNSGKLLGYIGLENGLEISNSLDSVFANRQQHWFLGIAIIAMLVSSLLAIPFSRFLVAPVLSLRAAAKKIASGNYEAPFKSYSKDELGLLARDLNTLAITLAENQHSRQQWIADISHELRTPIAVFKAELEGMIDGIIESDEAQLHSLYDEINRLTKLVDDLHQLSMSDRGSLSYHMSECDISEIIGHTFDAHLATLKSRHFEWAIDVQSETVLYCDEARLSQLFGNFMQNTLRYTDSSDALAGKIKVVISQEENHLSIRWQDSGPGVDPELLPKLFDRLYRVDKARDRASGGSGLGLAICASIVQAHNGSIKASESELGGVSVDVLLPLEQ